MHQIPLFYPEWSYIRPLLMIPVNILVGDLHRGHLGSSEGTNKFLLITHDLTELEARAWYHCACLLTTHPLIYNMTYVGQHVTSRDHDLRSNVDPNIQSHHTCFGAP